MKDKNAIVDYWTAADMKEARLLIVSENEQSLWEGKKLDKIIDYILAYSESNLNEQVVLDYGCGIGRLLKPLSSKVKFMHGVDISPKMIELSGEFWDKSDNVLMKVCNGEDLSIFEDRMFDFIYSILVFQHIPYLRTIKNLLKEFARTLKPKGYCCVQFSMQYNNEDSLPGSYRGHRPTEEVCVKYFNECGLNVIKIQYYKRWYFVYAKTKSNNSPILSVLLPVYNHAKYVSKAIDSILSQTYKDFELIIIDDASTEDLMSILSSYTDSRIRLHSNDKNIGVTKTLNKAIKLSRGKYLARQDSDDISFSKRFEMQIKAFDNEQVGLVGTWAHAIDFKGEVVPKTYLQQIREVGDYQIKDYLKQKNCLVHGSVMFRKEVVDKIGYYDPELYFAQDYNYWLRIAKFFDIKVVQQDLYIYRKHEETVRNIKMKQFPKIDREQLCRDRATKYPIIKNV